MRRWVWLALLSISTTLLIGFSVSKVNAENVTVTIGVGDTDLIVRGQTSPFAFVTIKSDDNVIGTTTALADGSYTKTFAAQTAGSQKVSVSAYTSAGHVTDTVSVHLSVIEHATTTAELFLPPSVNIEDAGLEQGQPLVLRGETTPLSTVKLYLDDSEYAVANSDVNGSWMLSIDSRSFAKGQHRFFLRSVDGIGTQSYPTASRTFTYNPSVLLQDLPIVPTAPSTGVPLTPPVIVFPTNGTSWDRSEINVHGTAQKEVQIEVWDGTRLLGSTWSDSSGDWRLRLFLESREYNLRARSCMNGKCSDFSPMTRFTYSAIQESLYIWIPRTTFTVIEGEAISINAEVVHGQSPYRLTIHWGDAKIDSSMAYTDRITRSHAYSAAGRYTIVLELEDTKGRAGSVQYTVYVKERDSRLAYVVVIPITLIATGLLILGVRRFLRSYSRLKLIR